MSEIFKNIPEIKYEGKNTKNPLAFRYYDADRVIMGKKMSEHLPFAMAWWHNLCAAGTDMFGRDTADKSFDEEKGTKKIVENSWFKRGNLLFIRGIRNGDQFKVKTYKNTVYSHSTAMIEKVYEDGVCLTRDERTQIE